MSPEGFHLYLLAVATVLGAVVGSFLNVCIARMPHDQSVVHPPSRCPSCGAGVRPRDNIPVLSWFILRGKCRDCTHPISPIYPAVELLTAMVAWLLFRRFVPTAADVDAAHLAAFGVYLVFAAMLIASTFIDVRHYIIPDELSIYAVPVGVAACALLTHLGYPGAPTWREAVLGAFFGGGSLAAVMGLYWLVRRREGMGMGDVKLLAMLGAFLGPWPALPFILFVSSATGALVGIPMAMTKGRGLSTALPFGPFLALAALLYLFHGPQWVARWLPGIALSF
jgi:leader peptidase (prepilin peptidase)/N-methyltransferase